MIPFLLPRWFRWIGFSLLSCGVFAYITTDINIYLDDGSNTLLSNIIFPFSSAYYISYCFPLVGLFLIAIAKLKNEDERTGYLRMSTWHKAIFISIVFNAVVFGLFYFDALDGLLKLIHGDQIEFVFTLLAMQLILLEFIYVIILFVRINIAGKTNEK